MTKKCAWCELEISKKWNCSSKNWSNRVKYCSVSCSNLSKVGKKNSSITKFKIGHTPWCKGQKRPDICGPNNNKWKGGLLKKICKICQKEFIVERYRANAKCCSVECAHENTRTMSSRIHMSKVHKQRVLDGKHNLYRGKSTEVQIFRQSIEYKAWRRKVYERDNYTCQMCAQRGKRLNADHIKPLCLFPELSLSVDNGRTLCVPCHKKTFTYLKNTFFLKKYYQPNPNNLCVKIKTLSSLS